MDLGLPSILLVDLIASDSLPMKNKLLAQNYALVDALNTLDGLHDAVNQSKPDAVLMSIGILDAQILSQIETLNTHCPVPSIIIASQHAPELVRNVVTAGVSSYIVDDVKGNRLPAIIDLAIERFKQFHALNTHLQQVSQRLSERKVIEKAKGIIMQQKSLSEEQAYSQMRRQAMNHGESMGVMAKKIISAFSMLD